MMDRLRCCPALQFNGAVKTWRVRDLKWPQFAFASDWERLGGRSREAVEQLQLPSSGEDSDHYFTLYLVRPHINHHDASVLVLCHTKTPQLGAQIARVGPNISVLRLQSAPLVKR